MGQSGSVSIFDIVLCVLSIIGGVIAMVYAFWVNRSGEYEAARFGRAFLWVYQTIAILLVLFGVTIILMSGWGILRQFGL